MSSCCPPEPQPDCCELKKSRPDYLLWGSMVGIIVFYGLRLALSSTTQLPLWVGVISETVFELMNVMWWSLVLAFFFVGILHKIPREFINSVLGNGESFKGVLRATLAGLLLDLCNHGILLIGMKLYERGASLAQVVAFLVSSPWNSFSLTLILFALIGIEWTVGFIVLSMVIALLSGFIFQILVRRGALIKNPHQTDLPKEFRFWQETRGGISSTKFNGKWFREVLKEGVVGSKMVLRWILFGVLLAGAVRAFVSLEDFQTYFGASIAGLGLTVVFATILEICSEGSTPIAADLVNRAGAPGNGFAFLMTGASTDYTEIMALKETTGSWKISLFLPLVTVPQVLLVSWVLNTVG